MQHKKYQATQGRKENKITKDCLQDTYLKIESFIFNFLKCLDNDRERIVKWLIMDTNNRLLKCSTLKLRAYSLKDTLRRKGKLQNRKSYL